MKKICGYFFLLIIFSLASCNNKNSQTQNAVSGARCLAVVTSVKAGDSKLFYDKIAAGVDGHLVFFHFDGTVYREFPDIAVNWLYPLEEERLMVAGNTANQICLLRFTEDLAVKEQRLLFESDRLLIDPTIVKYGGSWILSYVEIQGTVNNADPDAENGLYTVRCYRSEDLLRWEPLSDIVSAENNIEDADMLVGEGSLYYIFERESYDKGPSALEVTVSSDQGATWSRPKTIISDNADNELAFVFPDPSGYTLYYSSDVEDPGKSYNGASVYCARLSKDFSLQASTPVSLEEEKGILLYDVQIKDSFAYFLYSQNYITEGHLILKEIRYPFDTGTRKPQPGGFRRLRHDL